MKSTENWISEGTPRRQELPDVKESDIESNVPNIMKDMTKPYCVISAENAWSKPSSEDVFKAVPHNNKEMYVIPEAGHFDMYDMAPFVSDAFCYILPFFGKCL